MGQSKGESFGLSVPSHYGCRVSVGSLVASEIWIIGPDIFDILAQHAMIWWSREGDEESAG